ncbi:hypothetical protein OG689_01465 [Kitasatospora sp. NBC_00240]|uniref:GH85 family endohexosaminidase C-terminal domain-containing protein n=1 Tax=Kitasatospora sp. NBC_00240 TaxID=2903567 RepID=UPI002256901D|nr:hypothetical protein [Kitasatospora sp. NBC_00240]MCX5207994.1 hypothetical protein [Kitasatospora sp. NBC_00240]
MLGSSDVSATRKSLRLTWTASAAGQVHHYEVYRRNADGSRSFLGATPDDAWFVPRPDRAGTAAATDHPMDVTARYVRLVITRPTRTADPAARIYEFEAWGT